MIVCAALWLLAIQDLDALELLKDPTSALLCRITYDTKAKLRRLRLDLVSR